LCLLLLVQHCERIFVILFASACRLHDSIIQSWTCGILKAVYKSRTGVRFRKLQIVLRNLFFCRRCSFRRWVFTVSVQTCKA
jgi:hypothetical protein